MESGVSSKITLDLNKMCTLDDESTYNNTWYKVNENTYIFAKCNEDYQYVEFYISEGVDKSKVFLFCDNWNSDKIYSGELGEFLT